MGEKMSASKTIWYGISIVMNIETSLL